MIYKLSQINRAIEMQFHAVLKNHGDKHADLLDAVNQYFIEYVDFYELGPNEVLERHNKFVSRYNQDLKAFEKTGLFPLQNPDSPPFDIDRLTYDVALILSALVTGHRFQIIKAIHEITCGTEPGQCLVVGIGSGIELIFINKHFKQIDAYDLEISAFCKQKFKALNLCERPFSIDVHKKYEAIFAIEFIEHVEEPYEILNAFSQALRQGGKLVLTTIKNVPQFDHIHNFVDEKAFEKKAQDLGFSLIEKKVIDHLYLFNKVDANNIFYVFKKQQSPRSKLQ